MAPLQCFDMKNKHARIVGKMGAPGFSSVTLQFMKCGEIDNVIDVVQKPRKKRGRCRS